MLDKGKGKGIVEGMPGRGARKHITGGSPGGRAGYSEVDRLIYCGREIAP